MHCIISNFGDDSIALIQWAYDNQLDSLVVLSVDTGWQASSWHTRLKQAQKWLNTLGVTHHHLKNEHGFAELVQARKQFPSQQFHWCAGFLKGIVLLNWLEHNDEDGEATILLANRRDMSKLQSDLPEKIAESERFDDREVYYPLANFCRTQRDALITKTPFKKPLNHRSLECQPCTHLTQRDIPNLSDEDINKVTSLENSIDQNMFQHGFKEHCRLIQKNTNYYDEFAKTCGWDYGCGL